MGSKLTIADLARGLDKFGARYNALDVFADDVEEVALGKLPPSWKALDGDGGAFEVTVSGKPYFLRLFKNAGVVRVARESDVASGTPVAGGAVFGAIAGAAIGAAIGKKGEGIVGPLLLGLLVGAALGAAAQSQPAPHRVFTMHFDPITREWRTYSGGLVRWMKSELGSAA